ncbi:GNAT family N-acetyltransferase [Companilactobacillus jidongensis]|uniref:GNAT family N-acetyltransferase n=1 Tax=Companilactobacillus jidongensis TaxID=2486006 RepID=UPI000F78944E|nr:GNAT family N-acetyltransferase [Companilactobacillus jidongensis]
MKYVLADIDDLSEIMNLERLGFNDAEAGSEEAYRERIEKLHETFLTFKDEYGKVIGFVVGPAVKERFVKDEMYDVTPENLTTGGHQLIFTIAISPDYRGQGIGSKLLKQFELNAQNAGRTSIALTCLEDRIPFYEKNGYVNQGIANSEHGNEIWYNMEKIID